MSDGASTPASSAPEEPLYADCVADPIRLKRALAIEGLEYEIALLRVRLDELMKQKPVKYRLVTDVMNTLVRAVTAQHRLSRKARKDLADNLAAVLNSLGDQLLPADR